MCFLGWVMTSKIEYKWDRKKIQSHMTIDGILYKVIFSRLDKGCMEKGGCGDFSLLLEQVKGDHAYALGVSSELPDAAR